MTRLVLGVLVWSFTHFVPAAFAGFRDRLVARLGETGYKGVFTLLMALAIYLLISGWKATVPEPVFVPPAWGRYVTMVSVLAAFVLFFAPYPPNNIRRLLRHPQLIGVICWGVGHLFANGEARSIVLFGGLAAWAALEIVLINRRDRGRASPIPAPLINDLILVIAAIVLYSIVAAAHRWLFGFSPFA